MGHVDVLPPWGPTDDDESSDCAVVVYKIIELRLIVECLCPSRECSSRRF